LNIRKGILPLPARTCRKNIGPGESSQIANEIKRKTGESKISPTELQMKSNALFIANAP
jgi:hypothetical protein